MSGECYVCLEETHEKSPCVCESNLHKVCFDKLESDKCSICKHTFRFQISFRDICLLIVGLLVIVSMIVFAWILIEGTYPR